MNSGKIYDFIPWMSDIRYVVYCFYFKMFLFMNFGHDRISYLDQKFLSESRCFFVNEFGRVFLFCDD